MQVALDVRYQSPESVEFVGYVSDQPSGSEVVDGGYPILTFDELVSAGDIGVFVPVHSPAGRRSIFERLDAAGVPIVGARGLPHLAHPEADVAEGAIVTCTTRLGHNTRIGRGSIVLGDIVAHDGVVGEFTTLAVSSTVAGHVEIGNDVFVGLGAVIHNGTARRPLVIGDGAIIGAGAVVERSVGAGETIVGPRAMSHSSWRALQSRADAADQ